MSRLQPGGGGVNEGSEKHTYLNIIIGDNDNIGRVTNGSWSAADVAEDYLS